MIEFVICEDNVNHQKNIRSILRKILIKTNIEYKLSCFGDINNELLDYIKTPSTKIYIIDVELPSGSGVDLINEIRANGDWDSYIIVQSVHYQMAYEIYKKKLFIFDFINKFNRFDQELTEDINKILTCLNTKNWLSFRSDGIFYRIKLGDVIKLEYLSDKRKVLIDTITNSYEVSNNLNKLAACLSDDFIEVYRGIIINKNYIIKMDLVNDYIYLTKDLLVDVISKNKKKVLKSING